MTRLLFLVAAAWFAGEGAALASHPLDPLSAAEMTQAMNLLRQGGAPQGARVATLALREPPKQEVYAHRPGQPHRREAFAVLLDRAQGRALEAVIDLRAGKVTRLQPLPGVQPMVLMEEYGQAQRLLAADPRVAQALRRRGIARVSDVAIEPWAPSLWGMNDKDGKGRRLMRALFFLHQGAGNRYARPIEGLLATVDLSSGRVLEVSDTGPRPLPPQPGEFDSARRPKQRDKDAGKARDKDSSPPLRPLQMTQPQGASFTIEGHEVRWQGWRFRYSVHPREGLVLHQVGFEDRGAVRPVLYRASLAEMAVPYGDPDPNWSWRSAFDVGEYGVGQLGSSLLPGGDVPAYATLADAVLPTEDGAPRVLPRAVAFYERDGGVLWRHWDYVLDTTHSRRARELAVSFLTAVGNYDYMMTWVFRQDGGIWLELDLTGIMLAKGVPAASEAEHGAGHEGAHGHLVAPRVSAVHHQHFFSFRLDLDVDGAAPNHVLEMNVNGLPVGPKNPAGNAFTMALTPLQTEAARSMDLTQARKWIIESERRNRLGGRTGYLLLPGENSTPMAAPGSLVRRRAGFIDKPFWVTRYAPGELYAAGDYPNQDPDPGGLPRYVADGQKVAGEDVVVWYTLGVTHIPRPEEWPIMPSHRVGFRLLPVGFFAENPTLDVAQ
jgi:primary-amine oxidase